MGCAHIVVARDGDHALPIPTDEAVREPTQEIECLLILFLKLPLRVRLIGLDAVDDVAASDDEVGRSHS